jgi:uncharacterized Zn-finger protein
MGRIAIIAASPTIEDVQAPMDATTTPPPFETIEVDQTTVACDGGDGPLGHPRVFLHIEDQPAPGHTTRSVTCPYCSRFYVLKEGAGHASGH